MDNRIKNPDIDFYNGFRLAIKLLNNSSQYLNNAYEKHVSDEDKSKAVKKWADDMLRDLRRFEEQMYHDLKKMYGMNLYIGSDDCYYLVNPNESDN